MVDVVCISRFQKLSSSFFRIWYGANNSHFVYIQLVAILVRLYRLYKHKLIWE